MPIHDFTLRASSWYWLELTAYESIQIFCYDSDHWGYQLRIAGKIVCAASGFYTDIQAEHLALLDLWDYLALRTNRTIDDKTIDRWIKLLEGIE